MEMEAYQQGAGCGIELRSARVSKTRTVEDTEVLFLKAQECPTTHMHQYWRMYR